MIIVSGWLRVAADDCDEYLASCVAVVEAARALPDCLDFTIGADLLEPGRINVFEMWESAAAVEKFRAGGPSDAQQGMVIDAHVEQHEVAGTIGLA